MILQALTEYYATLVSQGKLEQPGWNDGKVSFALCLTSDGRLADVIDIRCEQTVGKKTSIQPQSMSLPTPCKRSSGVAANFLCDHSGYMLGIDNKGKPKRSAACFEACRALHETICSTADSPAAHAILEFFRTWQPEQAAEHPRIAEYLTDILAGGNLVFRVDGQYAHEDSALRRAWELHYSCDDGGDDEAMVCLVTGETGPVEKLHPSIKHVAGAQSSGASLVSFNAPSFCSYGKAQSLNAPTGKYAAFAYSTALNYLLSDREHVSRIGDTTVVCWARGGGDLYQSLFGYAMMGNALPLYTAEDLRGAIAGLCAGAAGRSG